MREEIIRLDDSNKTTLQSEKQNREREEKVSWRKRRKENTREGKEKLNGGGKQAAFPKTNVCTSAHTRSPPPPPWRWKKNVPIGKMVVASPPTQHIA